MINSITHNREEKNVHELKERNYTVLFRKREHRRGEDTYVNLFRITNEDTPGNQAEWFNKNEKNSIFIFKEDAPIEKNG